MSGLLGWTAVVSMMLSARVFLSDRGQRRAAVIILALLWLVPYLAVRTSSESASGALLAIGVAVLALGSAPADWGRRRFPLTALLLAGGCFGLAFECRFQIAFAVIGIVAWVLLVATEDWRRGMAAVCWILLGIVGPIALGTLIDRWGYGTWTIVPWRYFAVNILQHRADDFGVAPVWYYFRMANEHFQAPLTIVWTAATLVALGPPSAASAHLDDFAVYLRAQFGGPQRGAVPVSDRHAGGFLFSAGGGHTGRRNRAGRLVESHLGLALCAGRRN